MPLIHSDSRASIGQNIATEMAAGKPHRQAVAVALETARRYGRGRAAGGSSPPPQAPTYATANPGILSSGLMPTSRVGSVGLDPNTGALTPESIAWLQNFAMRGMVGGPDNRGAPPASFGMPQPAQAPAAPPMFPTLDTASGSMQNRGGRVARAPGGGVPSAAQMAPWFTRSEAHGMDHPNGLIHSSVPGRTDQIPMSVAAGSHVIPADVVAGLGEGNTLAGAHALDMALHTGPGGIRLPSMPRRSTIPHAPRLASGGAPGGVECIVAGGEYLLSPDQVKRIEHAGKRGHEGVDAWILERRAKDVKKIRALPGPVKS